MWRSRGCGPLERAGWGWPAYFLAPGLLYDATVAAARAAGAVGVAEPLGDVPELVRLVLSRVDAVPAHPAIAYAA